MCAIKQCKQTPYKGLEPYNCVPGTNEYKWSHINVCNIIYIGSGPGTYEVKPSNE